MVPAVPGVVVGRHVERDRSRAAPRVRRARSARSRLDVAVQDAVPAQRVRAPASCASRRADPRGPPPWARRRRKPLAEGLDGKSAPSISSMVKKRSSPSITRSKNDTRLGCARRARRWRTRAFQAVERVGTRRAQRLQRDDAPGGGDRRHGGRVLRPPPITPRSS